MSQEILYTSAPKGLRPGSRGFCTVVSTGGMARNLAERLESLSSYRHISMPHKEGVNPINYSHLHVTTGGRRYHVLSRIADAGLDYTNRTNKIAHHVALTAQEVAVSPGGPAWVISDSNFFVKQWDGELKTIPESRTKPITSNCDVGVCHAWKQAAGDAGWAGTLAETVIKNEIALSVIFDSSIDTLALVREAVALLPPSKRWEVTFCTYFTKLPAGVDCLWRFIPDGTQDADVLRRNAHARVIDLCSASLGKARDSELAEVARTGISRAKARPQSPGSVVSLHSERPTSSSKSPINRAPTGRRSEHEDSFDVEELLPVPVSRQLPNWHTPPSGASKIRNIALFALLILFVCGGIVGAYLAGTARSLAIGQRETDLPAEESGATEETRRTETGDLAQGDDLAQADAVEETDATSTSEADKLHADIMAENQRIEEEKQQKRAPEREDVEQKPNQPLATEPKRPDPFADIRNRQNRLSLPADKIDNGAYVELAKLFVDDPAKCRLTLNRRDSLKHKGIEIDIRSTVSGEWEVKRKTSVSVDAIATFKLAADSLQFRWLGMNDDLIRCSLEIAVGDQHQVCELIKPVAELAPIQMDVEENQHVLPIKAGSKLKLAVRFSGEGFGEVEVQPARDVAPGELITIVLAPTTSAGERLPLEIDAALDVSDPDKPVLRLKAFAYPLLANMIEKDKAFDLAADNLKNGAPAIDPKSKRSPLPEAVDFVRLETTKQLKYAETYRKRIASSKARDEYTRTLRVKQADDEADVVRKKIVQLRGTLKLKQDAVNKMEKQIQDAKLAKDGAFVKILEQRIKLSEIERDNVTRVLEAEEDELKTLDQVLELAKGKIDVPVWQEKALAQIEQFSKDSQAWCTAIEQLLTKVHNDGRIHFRVSAENDGFPSDLIRTEGWSEQPSEHGESF